MIIKPKDVDRVWRDVEQILNKQTPATTGWTYDVDADGQYTLRHNGVVKGHGDHAAAMQGCRNSSAKARVEAFGNAQNRSATTGDDVALARLRTFLLKNKLNAR